VPVAPDSHYFTSEPLDPEATRKIDVVLAGRPVSATTAPGVFSPGRIDTGTAVLLRTLARHSERSGLPASGLLVDLGSGWGPLALTMAALAPAARVIAVEINEAARELTAINASNLGLTNVAVIDPDQAQQIAGVDVIWSNPPVRVGKSALHHLLRSWLDRLSPTGHADIVVQRHLGADSLHAWLTESGCPTHRLASAKGYRVLRIGPGPAR
jgi:16S rRNA G1207 methylase RsmC